MLEVGEDSVMDMVEEVIAKYRANAKKDSRKRAGTGLRTRLSASQTPTRLKESEKDCKILDKVPCSWGKNDHKIKQKPTSNST